LRKLAGWQSGLDPVKLLRSLPVDSLKKDTEGF